MAKVIKSMLVRLKSILYDLTNGGLKMRLPAGIINWLYLIYNTDYQPSFLHADGVLPVTNLN